MLGDRNSIKNTDISRNFQQCGASHILAVSGLHVGIVIAMLTLFFNSLEWLVGKPKWTKYAKPVLLLLSLWCYAFIAGLAASIVRAATMFTIYYLVCNLFSRQTDSQTVVSLTAFGMLVYNPYYLFDIGFQFSFTAVASIIMFMRYTNPEGWYESLLRLLSHRFVSIREYLFRRRSRRSRFLTEMREDKFPFKRLPKMVWQGVRRYVTTILCVSLAAQILMFPLIAYYFQNFAVSTFVSSIIVIPLATILIPATFLYLLFASVAPAFCLTNMMASIVSFLSRCMLDSMEKIAEWRFLRVTDIPFSLADFFAVIVIILLIFLFLRSRNLWLALASSLSVVIYTFFSVFEINRQRDTSFVAVYNVSQTSAVHIHDSCHNFLITNDADRVESRVGCYWVRERIDTPLAIDSVVSFTVSDSLFYLLSNPLPVRSDTLVRLKVNTIVVQNNSVKDYGLLRQYFDFQHIVIDGTNYRRTADIWRRQRDSLRLDCHITLYDGTYLWKKR